MTDTQGPVYLPPLKDCSVDYMRNLIIGLQPFFWFRKVEVAIVEKLNELSIEKIYEEISKQKEVLSYFPARYVKDPASGTKRLRMPNREWAFTIFKTVKPEDFKAFIKRNKAENRSRIKTRENQGFEILEVFAQKAEEYDVMNYEKGTIQASIMNQCKLVSEKRKRDEARMNGEEVESSVEVEAQSDTEEEDDKLFEGDGGMPSYEEKQQAAEETKELGKVVKGLEVKLRMSAWDQTKDIEDMDLHAEEYSKIAKYLTEYYKEFDLTMPTIEEAFEIYE